MFLFPIYVPLLQGSLLIPNHKKSGQKAKKNSDFKIKTIVGMFSPVHV